MKKDSLTTLAVKTLVRGMAMIPGLYVAGLRDKTQVFFGALLGSISVSALQIAYGTIQKSLGSSSSND